MRSLFAWIPYVNLTALLAALVVLVPVLPLPSSERMCRAPHGSRADKHSKYTRVRRLVLV